MNWLIIIIFLVALYALIAGYIKYNKLWEEHVMFYGPILALKTDRVGFFDRCIPYSRFLRLYGTLGVIMVIIVSVLMSIMLAFALIRTVALPPEPTGIYAPQNLLAIPGVNEFIPFTFAVWFAFVITLVIHEFGHAILCRVEGIRVKCMGVLLAIIPIGAFVEPEAEDVENCHGMPKVRMFGAGITNNIVFGILCFMVMIALLGMAVPTSTPMVKGIYKDYPADFAGLPPDSIIKELNGIDVNSREDISAILGNSRPGDQISLLAAYNGVDRTYDLTLSQWPEEFPDHGTGFMGVYYYDANTVKGLFNKMASPLGFLVMMYVPIDTVMSGDQMMLGILAFDTEETACWEVPFSQFWGLIQVLFWCGWFNIAVGTFNALPFVPLDGGYIMQEGVTRFFERIKKPMLAQYVVASISWIMLFMMIALIALPYLTHLN